MAEFLRMEPDGVGVGRRLDCERAEQEMWSLEKPRTMLVALTSVLVVSLPANGGLMSEYSSVATVEVEESRIYRDEVGCAGAGGKVDDWDVESR
jgi:hypothetical protein